MKTYPLSSVTRPACQRGATLLIALIMLAAMALLAVFAFNSSTLNLRVVGNSQIRQEALAAVQAAIESTISTPTFITNPTAVAALPIAVTIAGASYSVTLSPAPKCYRYRVIPTAELDLAPPVFKDKSCLGAVQTDFGTDNDSASGNTTDSICANTEWNVRATVTDASSKASVTINQGIAARALTTDAATYCN